MGIFKKLSAAKTAVSAPQTYKNNPFSLLDSYTPLSTVQNKLYRELREAIPMIDAAIYKIIRLTGGFRIDSFLSAYFEQLLTYGTAVGEMITDS